MGDITMPSALEFADGAEKEVMDISKIATRHVSDKIFKSLIIEQSDVLNRKHVHLLAFRNVTHTDIP